MGAPSIAAFTVELGEGVYARVVDGPFGATNEPDAAYTLQALQGPTGEQLPLTTFTCELGGPGGGVALTTVTGVDSCEFTDLTEGDYTVTI